MKRQGLLLMVFVGGAALLCGTHLRFPWALPAFPAQLRLVAPLRVAYGVLCIYGCFVLRAFRWSLLLWPTHKAHWRRLLAPQLIGFAAVALFGRAADLARPYLVARRLGTPVTMQVAVYSIERAFDLGAAAILFSFTLALAPRSLPHHEAYARAGEVSLVITALLAALACSVRLAGAPLARCSSALLGGISPRLASAAAARVLELQHGLGTLASARQFAGSLALSLLLWTGIAFAYLQSAHAFRSTPALAGMTFTGIMLLLATSLGASLLQIPVLGWFTQVAALAAAYHGLFGVPLEAASACGVVTLLVTTLSVIPAGLAAAQLQGQTLRENLAFSAEIGGT